MTQAQGSGFFITADGYLVTNNHVVEHATDVQVVTDDGTVLPAKVIGTDKKTDLALLKVTKPGTYPFVHWAEKAPRVGDWVIAVGNPFGLGGTVTAGIVSARGRDIGAGPYDDFLQIDAPVNRGNSGGPTFNANGNVVGVNTAIFSPSGGSVGIGFAIPSEVAQTVIHDLMTKGSVARGWIGVQIQPVTDEIAESLGLKSSKGALVAEAQPSGPASAAGIKSGDVILGVDGKPVDGRARAGPHHRRHGSGRKGVADLLARRQGEDGRRQARHAAELRQGWPRPKSRATSPTIPARPPWRRSASSSRLRPRCRGPAATASSSRTSTRTAPRRRRASRSAT